MDAHVFRIIGAELITLLSGARIEKIYAPAQGVTLFQCYSGWGPFSATPTMAPSLPSLAYVPDKAPPHSLHPAGETAFPPAEKFRFALRTEKESPSIFLVSTPLPNPQRPPAPIMRLRKYLAGHRLGQGLMNFEKRILAFPVIRSNDLPSLYLVLSIKDGASIAADIPEGLQEEPVWPSQDAIKNIAGTLLTNKEVMDPQDGLNAWVRCPLLTPALRESLAFESFEEASALLVDLEYGEGPVFFYMGKNSHPDSYYAWPLPEALAAKKNIRPLEEFSAQFIPQELQTPLLALVPNLQKTSSIDEKKLLGYYAAKKETANNVTPKRAVKRLKKTLKTLIEEEKRLSAMQKRQKEAMLIQENLWKLASDQKTDLLAIETLDEEGRPVLQHISLDPRFTVKENMQTIFHHAARGKRGVKMVEQRKAEIETELQGMTRAKESTVPFSPEGILSSLHNEASKNPSHLKNDSPNIFFDNKTGVNRERSTTSPIALSTASGALSGIKSPARVTSEELGDPSATRPQEDTPQPHGTPQKNTDKNCIVEEQSLLHNSVSRFVLREGYTILRGKNAQGNHALLKLAQPHDYWLHANDGPSAHAIIRRAHPQDEVPENIIHTAARLVAEKSWQRDDEKAEIMLAYVKHVKPVKGAKAGTVRVDKVIRQITVKLLD